MPVAHENIRVAVPVGNVKVESIASTAERTALTSVAQNHMAVTSMATNTAALRIPESPVAKVQSAKKFRDSSSVCSAPNPVDPKFFSPHSQ